MKSLGKKPEGARLERLQDSPLWSGDGGAFLPVHWGTFSLALHDWDEPAETLLALGPKQGVQLVMPRLGEAVEPSRVETVTPWWRGVDARGRGQAHAAEPEPMTLPKAMPWPVE